MSNFNKLWNELVEKNPDLTADEILETFQDELHQAADLDE